MTDWALGGSHQHVSGELVLHLWSVFSPLFCRFLALLLGLVCFTGEAGYSRVTIPKVCPLIKWFYGQVKFGEWWVEYRERGFLTALLRAFGVCHNFPETGFGRQVSHYLSRGHILPLSILLGLVFPGTHLEKICPTGNTGGLGSSHDFVPRSLCVPGPFVCLPSHHACCVRSSPSLKECGPLGSTCFYLGDEGFHAWIWVLTLAFPSAPDSPLNQNPCLISFSSKPKSSLTNLFLSSGAVFFQARNFAVIPDFSYLLHPLCYFFIPSAKHSSLMFFPTVFFSSHFPLSLLWGSHFLQSLPIEFVSSVHQPMRHGLLLMPLFATF